MRMGFIRDFAAALSCLSALSAILDSVLLFLLCALELGGYYIWRRRAKREAELGRFLPTRSHLVLQMLALLVLVMGCAVVLYSDKEERGTYLAILTGIVLLDALIWGIKGLLKRRGGSAELNRGITLVSVLILSFIFRLPTCAASETDNSTRRPKTPRATRSRGPMARHRFTTPTMIRCRSMCRT